MFSPIAVSVSDLDHAERFCEALLIPLRLTQSNKIHIIDRSEAPDGQAA
jgi:hypothetical protein